MAKFIKLRLKDVPKKGEINQWRKVIDNKKDLDKHHALDAALNMEAFLSLKQKNGSLQTDHLFGAAPRAVAIGTLLRVAIECTPENEKVYPTFEVAKITDNKYLAMLKHLNTVGPIQINEVGGWSGLDSFIECWKADIISEIEKEDQGFPVEDEALKSDTLILENSSKELCFGENRELRIQKQLLGSIATIYNLREVDRSYLVKCLKNCKNVYINSQLQDLNQLNDFMHLFENLASKNIYLELDSDNVAKIQAHPSFNKNNSIHNIHFN